LFSPTNLRAGVSLNNGGCWVTGFEQWILIMQKVVTSCFEYFVSFLLHQLWQAAFWRLFLFSSFAFGTISSLLWFNLPFRLI
jgi:hypothetical protein